MSVQPEVERIKGALRTHGAAGAIREAALINAERAAEIVDDRVCEAGDGPETDAEPMVECQSDGGMYHVGCHEQRCTSRSCHTYNGTDDAVEGR